MSLRFLALAKSVEDDVFYSKGEQSRRKDYEFIFGDGRFQMSMRHPNRYQINR